MSPGSREGSGEGPLDPRPAGVPPVGSELSVDSAVPPELALRDSEQALRESEARYRSLFANMLEGFAYCRMIFEEGEPRDFVYLDVNEKFDDLTGLRDVVGKRVTEIIPGIRESNPEIFEIYGRVALTGTPEWFETYLDGMGWLSISVYSPEREHFVAVFENITERKRAESALRDSELALRESMDILARVNEQRRELLVRLVDAQEDERAAIAEDLHDDSIQVMTAVGMRLASLLRSGSEEERTETLRKLEETVSAAIARLRRLVFELRPRVLDEEGLAAALRAYLDHLGPEVEFASHVDNGLASEPSPQARVILYRITQEALANVRKHARATHVTVTIEHRDDGSLVRVADDGVGFDPTSVAPQRPGHLGLAAMRERAEMVQGWCKVESVPGAGTTVEFWVPQEV
jgi:PAS domain S-box-containing protein